MTNFKEVFFTLFYNCAVIKHVNADANINIHTKFIKMLVFHGLLLRLGVVYVMTFI